MNLLIKMKETLIDFLPIVSCPHHDGKSPPIDQVDGFFVIIVRRYKK